MPPKFKTKNTLKKTSSPLVVEGNEPECSQSKDTDLLQRNFESEICWCVQQLEISLNSTKMNEKQSKYHLSHVFVY